MSGVSVIRTKWSSEENADRFTVENPATGAPLATVRGGGEKEVHCAVRAAFDAHLSWTSAAAPRARPAAACGCSGGARERRRDHRAGTTRTLGKVRGKPVPDGGLDSHGQQICSRSSWPPVVGGLTAISDAQGVPEIAAGRW
jgi:hypothetical protein